MKKTAQPAQLEVIGDQLAHVVGGKKDKDKDKKGGAAQLGTGRMLQLSLTF